MIFRGEGRSTHSLYLEILSEQGLVGLMYFLGMISVAISGISSAARQFRRAGDARMAKHFAAFGAGLAGYLAGMTLLHEVYPRFLWIVIILGIESGRIATLRIRARTVPERPRSTPTDQNPVADEPISPELNAPHTPPGRSDRYPSCFRSGPQLSSICFLRCAGIRARADAFTSFRRCPFALPKS